MKICIRCKERKSKLHNLCPECIKEINHLKVVEKRKKSIPEIINLSILSEKEKLYYRDRRSGLTTYQIGEKHGVSQQCVSEALRNIISKYERVRAE